MAYEWPPEPGTYYIKSVAAPKNIIEVIDHNQERAVCSPKVEKAALNQQWYIQRSGRGYKIKNVKYGVYLAPHSAQPKHATVIGTSPRHAPADWYFMRTHDGFSIQYGEGNMSIDLHHGSDAHGNPIQLWGIAPQDPAKRWKLERISHDVGGEVAENVEDRITDLRYQLEQKDVEIAAKDAEIATKNRLLAQKEQELRDALQGRREVPSSVIQAQLAELRFKIEGLEAMLKSGGGPDAPNNTD